MIHPIVAEMKSLLEKYNATISADVDDSSDSHGIRGEVIKITIRPDPNRFKEIEVFVLTGWDITSNDL